MLTVKFSQPCYVFGNTNNVNVWGKPKNRGHAAGSLGLRSQDLEENVSHYEAAEEN